MLRKSWKDSIKVNRLPFFPIESSIQHFGVKKNVKVIFLWRDFERPCSRVHRHAGKIVGQGGPTGAKGHLLL